ncbi:TRAP transporter large permease [Bordetella bronchiseptica]|uniref:TRAP transporter large permease n=1 Tax=Bordetella bronchiseptica TaxID=518 RepID=UPI000460F8FB|nr:TRAP transporter large permease subunit [Bordetella bronchiseptica]KDD18034.1 TRAP transporter, DctM subunit [Bordetella bronchiseptica MBORD707]
MLLGALYFGGLVLFLMAGIHVASAIFMTAVVSDWMSMQVLPSMIGNTMWSTMNEFLLVAIPLFILLGEILTRSGVADRMYKALAAWLQWLPGGLLHTNIATCALFAATSGSSVATSATVGTVALPTLQRLGYRERLVLGSIAAGGTLGILIPPSINMVVYGALAEVSVGKLFAAGIVPGIIVLLLMMVVIVIMALLGKVAPDNEKLIIPLAMRLKLLIDVLPVVFIFGLVMGGIYLGIATPTEAAALGVVGAIAIAAANRTLSVAMLHAAFLSALRTTAMVVLVVTTAFVLNFSLSLAGIPQALSEYIGQLGWSPTATIWVLVAFYLILGCFLEAIAMMVTTVGVVVPLVVSLGFDPLWFGIFMTMMMELALITPPVGLNLFVAQNIRLSRGGISDVYIGVLPFAFAMMVFVTLLIYFPQIALWLPNRLF